MEAALQTKEAALQARAAAHKAEFAFLLQSNEAAQQARDAVVLSTALFPFSSDAVHRNFTELLSSSFLPIASQSLEPRAILWLGRAANAHGFPPGCGAVKWAVKLSTIQDRAGTPKKFHRTYCTNWWHGQKGVMLVRVAGAASVMVMTGFFLATACSTQPFASGVRSKHSMVAPQQVLLACNQTPNPITTGNVTRLQESDARRSLVTLELELLLRQQRHDPAGDENTNDAPCCSKAQCYISALSCIAFCPRCSSCRDVLLRRLQTGLTHIACAREQKKTSAPLLIP